MNESAPVQLGRRIMREMERRDWTIRQLKTELDRKAPNTPGSSYGNVWSYANGQGPENPNRALVTAMAELFGVLPSYLFDGGPRTPEEAQAAKAVGEQEGLGLMEGVIRKVFPEYFSFPFEAQSLFTLAMVRFQRAMTEELDQPGPARERYAPYAALFALMRQSVMMPLWAWSDDPDLEDPWVQDYLRQALSGFVASIPDPLPRFPVYRLEVPDKTETVPLSHEETDDG